MPEVITTWKKNIFILLIIVIFSANIFAEYHNICSSPCCKISVDTSTTIEHQDCCGESEKEKSCTCKLIPAKTHTEAVVPSRRYDHPVRKIIQALTPEFVFTDFFYTDHEIPRISENEDLFIFKTIHIYSGRSPPA